MFKKINTTTLIIVLVLLGGLVTLNKFYFAQKSESTFNDEFVKIDSAKINQIFIYPKAENGKEIKITKQAKGWEVQSGQMKTSANESMVDNLIKSFADLKSKALAGNSKANWKEFQVDDSTGTRIKILTSDNKKYEMIVGKFGYDPTTRNGMSYVRRNGEESVYTVNGYLSFSVNRGFKDWRNNAFIKGNKNDWTKLTFTYPGDSSFVLKRENGSWTVNGAPADSIKTERYLNLLSNQQSNSFVENYMPSGSPVYSLSIESNNKTEPITAVAYPGDSIQKLILHSSLNSDAWFSDGNSRFAERIFVGPRNFMP